MFVINSLEIGQHTNYKMEGGVQKGEAAKLSEYQQNKQGTKPNYGHGGSSTTRPNEKSGEKKPDQRKKYPCKCCGATTHNSSVAE